MTHAEKDEYMSTLEDKLTASIKKNKRLQTDKRALEKALEAHQELKRYGVQAGTCVGGTHRVYGTAEAIKMVSDLMFGHAKLDKTTKQA